MQWRAGSLAAGLCLLFATGGCPVTDDYYVESSHVSAGTAGTGETGDSGSSAGASNPSGGSASAGSAAAGSANGGGFLAGADAGEGGASELANGGATGEAGAPFGSCMPSTERCNGHDDDCDELVDELACSVQQGCTGFVVSARPEHGYMLCTQKKDYMQAKDACAAQNMRLAWLETEQENRDVAKKVEALAADTEVILGANDIANEGKWGWDGGVQFWNGEANGSPVEGRFSAWTNQTPNNANNDEDCAVITPLTATWGDRNCAATYAYLCEEAEP